jgi:polyhydroxybutyrate depolymerase
MRRVTVNSGGEPRECLVHVPEQVVTSGRKAPLVLAFHGGGINAERMAEFCGLATKADEAEFIVAFPEGTGRVPHARTWNVGQCCGHAWKYGVDDVSFVARLLDELLSTHAIDERRVYACGVSNGGMMSYTLGLKLSDRFAAIGSVAGQMCVEIEQPPAHAVGVLHFHGTADEFTPVAGGRGPRSPSQTRFEPVSTGLGQWIEWNGCGPVPERRVWRDPSGLEITHDHYSPGRQGASVEYYEIAGGGHTWPGRQPTLDFLGASTTELNANDRLWEFFSRHERG